MNALADNSPLGSRRASAARPAPGIVVLCALTLVLGTALSIAAFVWLRNDALDSARLKFEREASDAHHNIEARVRSYTDIVYGLRALLYSSDRITRTQFHQYVSGLDLGRRFPGFLNLNYAEHVRPGTKPAFEQRLRNDTSLDPRGYPNFRIHPPGERPYYHVLVYLEPMSGNELSLGRDIVADATIREIFERQIFASDQLSSSGRPRRIEGPPSFWGIAMRLPVFRTDVPLDTQREREAALVGTLGAGFRVDELLQNVLDRSTLETLRFQVYESGSAEASADREERLLLFDSMDPDAAPSIARRPHEDDFSLSTELPLKVAGRLWEIRYGTRNGTPVSPGSALIAWLVLAGGLLISGLLCGIAYSLGSSRSRAIALADAITHDLRKSEAELRSYAERLKAVSRRLFEVQETERRLLATELHDRVGQSLTALGINLSIFAARASPDGRGDLADRIEESKSLIEQTMDSMRNVMGELRPQAIDEYGLIAPLRALGTGFSARTGIHVVVNASASEARLPRTVELALFRIAQEALNNAAKHSRAKRVDISLFRSGERATLSVEDDGVGFDAGAMDASGPDAHWGLLIMRERAEAVGARLFIRSAPARGTKVSVEYRF